MISMNVSGYVKRANEIADTGLMCSCCGAEVYAMSPIQESICNFCESDVNNQDRDAVHENPNAEKTLMALQQSALEGRWMDGVQYADAIAATKDPYFMFGASSYYTLFSDYTYHGVDYTQGGFMYANAQKRSDELQKNKFNAVALRSKSRECLFKAIKIIKDTQEPEERLLFINFMANMRLKRYLQAEWALAQVNAHAESGIIKNYANMVYEVERNRSHAPKYITESFSYGVSNTFYYLSLHLALRKDLDKAIRVLDKFIPNGRMPAALYLMHKLKDFKAASDI